MFAGSQQNVQLSFLGSVADLRRHFGQTIGDPGHGRNNHHDIVTAVIGKRHCDGIVLSMTARPKRKVIHEHLPCLGSQLMIPVFVGGIAAEQHRTEINACGAICVGTDVQPALVQIRNRLAMKKKSKQP